MTPDFTGSSIFLTELACDATTPDPTAWQMYHSTSIANLHSRHILSMSNQARMGACVIRKSTGTDYPKAADCQRGEALT